MPLAISTNRLFSITLVLLFSSGLWNFLFGNIGLNAWKQISVAILFFVAYKLCRHAPYKRMLIFFAAFSSFELIAASFLQGVSIYTALFNIFFYISWIPFFIWGGTSPHEENWHRYIMPLLLICLMGLVADLLTDWFMFLSAREDILTNEYYEEYQVIKRSVFWFVAPTLVMPMISGFLVILLAFRKEMYISVLAIAVVILTAMLTASTNAVVMGVFVLFGMAATRLRVRSIVLLIIALMPFVFYVVDWFSEVEQTESRVARTLKVGQTDRSDPNEGRFYAWGQALSDISKFSILEHMVGDGLGATSNQQGGVAKYTHGESSFLQAHLEGGIVGLMLRLMPFLMAVHFYRKSTIGGKRVIAAYILGDALLVAVAPIFGNIPSQAILGYLVGVLSRRGANTLHPVVFAYPSQDIRACRRPKFPFTTLIPSSNSVKSPVLRDINAKY